MHPQTGRTSSIPPPTLTEPTTARGSTAVEAGLQRRTSNNYGHHRQTSVIHGLQHSRNTSFNTPSTNSLNTPSSSSPLSSDTVNITAGAHVPPSSRRGINNGTDNALAYTSPVSPWMGHSQGPSIDGAIAEDGVPDMAPPNARKRTAGSRTRRGHTYQASSSSHHHPEPRTPGEYALHHLFNAFMLRADQKIDQCIAGIEGMTAPVEQVCGTGVDPSFDQLISALAHVVRPEPKPLVDSLMLWRKAKSDTASSYKKQIHQHRAQLSGTGLPASLPRRHTEPVQVLGEAGQTQPFPSTTTSSTQESLTEELTLADRRATISVYILCRVLIEIFEQCTIPQITTELARKLEDIVFSQLKDSDPAQLMISNLRLANWRIYGQVLGQMSRLGFMEVSSRYITQLGVWQQRIAELSGNAEAKELETRVELLLLSMRYLHISTAKTSSVLACDFLSAVGNLFSNAHGPRIKQGYCQLLEKFLSMVADVPACFQGFSKWKDFIDMVSLKVGQMLIKARHWDSAFPVSILLICLSPIDSFLSQCLPTITSLTPKLKDKATRTQAMRAICQLVWTYLQRSSEGPTTRHRKLEDVIKATLPPGRKPFLCTESTIAEAVVEFARIIGSASTDLCFRTIIYPFISLETVQGGPGLRIEQLEPERTVLGIRACLALMSDLEQGDSGIPPFPVFTSSWPQMDGFPASTLPARVRRSSQVSDHAVEVAGAQFAVPIKIEALDDSVISHYLRFCEVLGKIIISCDNAFGGQAVLNERFSALVLKTPLVDTLALMRKEEINAPDQKQSYYELMHVAIQALPKFFSEHTPLNPLINLLCTASAHIQASIALSATQSLKAIARQGYAQAVATAFPRFIFSYDSQYSTMSDDGRLGPAHMEATLTLYLELLQIWTEQIKQKVQKGSARAFQMEMVSVVSHADEIEAYGLFFLCSQSRRVRGFSINVLQLVIQFDEAVGKDVHSRIIKVLESQSDIILDLPQDTLTVAERSRLQKDKRRNAAKNTLIDLCSSEVSYDSTLWFKAFPNLIRVVFEHCPNAVAVSRGIVCDRLGLMQADIDAFGKLGSGTTQAHDLKVQGRSSATPAEVLFDQWKLYLIMACATLSSSGEQSQSQLDNAVHGRKTSKGIGGATDKLQSARALFSAMIPLLKAGPDSIRDAVVIALGSINRKLYRTLLNSLQYAVITCNDEAKARLHAHQRNPSSPQRSQTTERLRTEVTHVYKLTASFLRFDDILADEWILANLINYNRDLRIFLSDVDVQNDWRFHKLRFHYCGLIEEIFEGISKSKEPSRWLPFEARKSAFSLMEEWCGYAAQDHPNDVIDTNHTAYRRDYADRSHVNAAMEKDKNKLRVAALSAMAALCAGPITIRTESHAVLSFQLPRMLSWVNAIFESRNDKMHSIGRRALRSLILHNIDHPILMEHAVERCYRTENPKALESYFGVVAEVLMLQPGYPVAFWKILGIVVFTLGNDNRETRMKSAHLLRTLDEKHEKSSNLQDFDIRISDKTRAIYKLAQFEYSKRLAKAHPDLAFTIFSEFSLHFKQVSTDHQRNMVAAILPWLQTLQLQVDPGSGGPTAVSYMLMANMLEITVSSSAALHNEVQALWQALATGPHAGNVQLILDFVIYLSMERKEQNFVESAKQIVVYLSTTPAGSRVLEFFLLQLTPKSMVNDKKVNENVIPDTGGLPYVADLSFVLPMGNKQVSIPSQDCVSSNTFQAGLSMGQVALVFLVDLMVPPVSLTKDEAIKLIHTVLILWDHYNATVQEQAREMLIHLLHELVTTKIEHSVLLPKKQQIEDIVDGVRHHEDRVNWSYEDNTGKDGDDGGNRVPSAMSHVAQAVVSIFGLAYENFSDLLAKEALHWASICPVRHLACRSFQVFRCISVKLDIRMLSDMLARLSNTIADEQIDYQTFSMEILTTLRVIIAALEPKNLLRFHQLFWTTCACLNTIHEREFYQALGMLEKVLDRLDFSDSNNVKVILAGKPPKWEGEFDGLQPLIHKGMRSADSFERTLQILETFARIPDNVIVGTPDRLLYNVLANLPVFLNQLDTAPAQEPGIGRARALSVAAKTHGHEALHLCLQSFADGHFSRSKLFLRELLVALKASYLREHDADSLIFMIGLLTNQISWFRVKVMDILCELIPMVDMRSPSITSHGPDLISPLLRLLQTEHCMQALEVMDHIMVVSANPMERHHMRMSMASGTAKAIRKQYERTQSLYGIPHPSGWSIPMPALYSSLTRNNVHAVFYTCADAHAVGDQLAQTPEVEFHADDGYTDSYFPSQSRSGTMRSMETATETNMGDIVNTLDSLDDFFDDSDVATTPTGTTRNGLPPYVAAEMQERSTDLYDAQTAPILRKSLARTSSTVSFQNGLAESRPPMTQYHTMQSNLPSTGYNAALQSSFSSHDEMSGPGPSLPDSTRKPSISTLVPPAPSRPGLHSRSITSPANQYLAAQLAPFSMIPSLPSDGSLTSDSYEDSEVLSDGENSPFPSLHPTSSTTKGPLGPGPLSAIAPNLASGQSTPVETGTTGGAFSISSMRRGMRRLTGGKSESQKEKDKVREINRLRALSTGQSGGSGVPAQSPRVPRVPAEYLTGNSVGPSPATSPGL